MVLLRRAPRPLRAPQRRAPVRRRRPALDGRHAGGPRDDPPALRRPRPGRSAHAGRGDHRARPPPSRGGGDQRAHRPEVAHRVSGQTAMLVRADASAAIGMGHAMRCLALAQALGDEQGRRTVFLMADPPGAFAERAAPDGIPVAALEAAPGGEEDAAATLALAAQHGAEWVVVDGYHFDGGYQRALVAGGARVLAFDDHGHAGTYHADLVLNQNLGAGPEPYARRDAR